MAHIKGQSVEEPGKAVFTVEVKPIYFGQDLDKLAKSVQEDLENYLKRAYFTVGSVKRHY